MGDRGHSRDNHKTSERVDLVTTRKEGSGVMVVGGTGEFPVDGMCSSRGC